MRCINGNHSRSHAEYFNGVWKLFSSFIVINLTWKYLCAFNLTLEWETLKGIPIAFISSYKCQRQRNINMRRLNCFMRRETGKFGERYFRTAAVQLEYKYHSNECKKMCWRIQLEAKGFLYKFAFLFVCNFKLLLNPINSKVSELNWHCPTQSYVNITGDPLCIHQ